MEIVLVTLTFVLNSKDCKKSVATKSFYEMDNQPVCGDCLGIEDDEEEEDEE